MNRRYVTQEELNIALQSFEQMGGMAKYAEIQKSASNVMRDNFDMTERALRMTQTLHEKQLQGFDQWLGTCRYLLTLFATTATAGLTIGSTDIFKNDWATWIGLVGAGLLISIMFIFSVLRTFKLRKQEEDIKKLHKAFEQGQEIANMLKMQANDVRGEMTDKQLREQMEKVLKIMKENKK